MQKNGAGRKSAYELRIKPNFDSIRTMVENGISERRIAHEVGVAMSTWMKYKREKTEFSELLRGSREKAVQELEAVMMRLARGFTVKIKKYFKIRHVEYDNGKKASEHDELVEVEEERYFPPSFHACRFLLMNWGGYMSEPAAQAQREKEFAHKQAMDERNNW